MTSLLKAFGYSHRQKGATVSMQGFNDRDISAIGNALIAALDVAERLTYVNLSDCREALQRRFSENYSPASPIALSPNISVYTIGKRLGLSTPVVNMRLEALGFQHKEGSNWRVTEKGKNYGTEKEYLSAAKGRKRIEIHWSESVVQILKNTMRGD